MANHTGDGLNSPPEYRYSRSTAPPRYSAVFADPGERLPVDALPTQHEFVLRGGIFKPKPWATLRVYSRPSKVTQKHPIFFGGDIVTGTIDLKLDNQVINSISIVLKGLLVTSFRSDGGSYIFLEHTHNVWSKTDGDPREPTSTRNNSNGKLSGKLEFSFAFPFPTTVNFSSLTSNKGRNILPGSMVYQTPQTFLEHNITSNVEYELVLLITHGALRPDSKLKSRVRFIPQITPDPPSDMRQMAYSEGALLPGPEADPEGWASLPQFSIKGILNQHEKVELDYHLYLAKPLCYTRGTVIPCYLMISSHDSRSLEILADPQLQYVRLTRRIRYFDEPAKCVEQYLQGKEPTTLEEVEEAELAVWWVPPKDVLQEPYLKRLEGEIHLAKELTPSSNFLPLSVEYSAEVMPLSTGIFKHSVHSNVEGSLSNKERGSQEQIILSYPVTIATFNPSGPAQVAFTQRQRPSLVHRQDGDNGVNFHRMSSAKFGYSDSAGLCI